jgi:A/G-specific adenine glycosylase
MKEVAVGIIFRDGSVLTGQRKPSARYPLKWEFPGGKLEPGETPTEALTRELHEELGIVATPGPEFHHQEWDYGDRSWRVYYFPVHTYTGVPENRTFAQIQWVTPEELREMDILEGNKEVVKLLCEKKGRRQKEVQRLRRTILKWYRLHGRTLPWRGIHDPYRILLSEIMLQQTQVSRVLVKYPLFLKRFPTLSALARAKRSDAVRAWQGMGYNNRAVRLHALAQTVVRDHRARLPKTEDELIALPGIGTYTARAVMCSAFGAPVSFVDVNIRRLLSRVLWSMPHTAAMKPERTVVDVAEQVLPRRRAYDWNQALMDLGATVCTSRLPQCGVCPLSRMCASAHVMSAPPRSRGKQEPSLHGVPRRIYRGRIIDQLRKSGRRAGLPLSVIGPRVLPRFSPQDRVWLEHLLASLERDGLVRMTGDGGNRVVRLA